MRIISSFSNLPLPSSPPFFPIHTKSQTNPLILISLGRNLIENRNIFHPLDLSINEHTKHTIANVASANNTSKQLWRCGTANRSEREEEGGGQSGDRATTLVRMIFGAGRPNLLVGGNMIARRVLRPPEPVPPTGTRRDARTNIILSTRGESEEKRVVREDRGREEWAGSVDAPCSPSGPNSTLPVRENTSRLPYPRGYELYRRNSNNPEFPRVVIRCSPLLSNKSLPLWKEKYSNPMDWLYHPPCPTNPSPESGWKEKWIDYINPSFSMCM